MVAVHVIDQGGLPHGKLIVVSRLLDARGLDPAEIGSIRIESNAGGSRSTCESTPPDHFNVHGTAKFLNGTKLRIVSANPVRVEIEDSAGKVLAFHTADPASHLAVAIAW